MQYFTLYEWLLHFLVCVRQFPIVCLTDQFLHIFSCAKSFPVCVCSLFVIIEWESHCKMSQLSTNVTRQVRIGLCVYIVWKCTFSCNHNLMQFVCVCVCLTFDAACDLWYESLSGVVCCVVFFFFFGRLVADFIAISWFHPLDTAINEVLRTSC